MDTLSEILADVRFVEGHYYQCRLGAPWHLSMPANGRICFYIVTQGHIWLKLDNMAAVEIKAGEILVLHAAVRYSLHSDAACRELSGMDPATLNGLEQPYGTLTLGGAGEATTIVHGSGKLAGGRDTLLRALPTFIHAPIPLGDTGAWQNVLPLLIENGTKDYRQGRAVMVNRICELLWTECVRNYVSSLPVACQGWLRALQDRYVCTALGKMHSEPAYPWTVPELAAVSGLSRSAFAARFGEVMNESPQAYLTRHRMQIAAQLLVESSLSMTVIANQVGYGSETAFSQAFKREMGKNPSQWRIGMRQDGKDSLTPTAA